MATIVFAYDGSIHGDWVGRYAIRLARAAGSGLEVVHVDDGSLSPATLESRFAHLREVAVASGVEVALREIPRTRASVAHALDAGVGREAGRILVSGLRARKGPRGLLHETVSEHLLRSARHDVLAIRVVSPSLMGHPRHLLFCLSESPHAVRRAGPFLALLAPELTRLSLLTVVSPWLGRLARPTAEDLRALRAAGWAILHRAEAELRGALAPFDIPFDPHVSVSPDWAGEITREAGRTRAEIVVVGATDHSLTRRRVLGNPLERVLEAAVCDVAIFRRAGTP